MDLTIGLDVGTSCAKGALLRDDGVVITQVTGPTYEVQYPGPGWAEQDPEEWWHSSVAVIRALVREVPPGATVRAIGVSGQGCACTLLDVNAQVLRPAIIWLDSRAGQEVRELQERYGQRLARLNGNAFGAFNVEPKLLWMTRHEPMVVEHAAYSLTTTAYIVFRLTNVAAMNIADGGLLCGFNPATADWDRPFLEEIGIPSRLFPPLYPCTAIVGAVVEAAAEETGLHNTTLVIAGGEDTPAAALSIGVCNPGDGLLSLGTAAVAGLCIPAEKRWSDARLLAYPHVVAGRQLVSGSMASAGAVTEWLRREFGVAYLTDTKQDPSGIDYFQQMEHAIERSQPGANGVIALPYFSGELHPLLNPDARGVLFGLSLSTTREDIARALVEGSAVAIRHNLKVAMQAGIPIDSLRATGGASQSPVWCRIISDMTGIPVLSMRDGGAPVGDAMLAAEGAGLISSAGELAQHRAEIERITEPDLPTHAHYNSLFEAHLELYRHVMPDFLAQSERRRTT